ncbi:unnamed protein product [Laminaria digitata]
MGITEKNSLGSTPTKMELRIDFLQSMGGTHSQTGGLGNISSNRYSKIGICTLPVVEKIRLENRRMGCVG